MTRTTQGLLLLAQSGYAVLHCTCPLMTQSGHEPGVSHCGFEPIRYPVLSHGEVTFAGKATAWMRTAESSNALTFHFCPICGSTVYWEGEGFPGYIAVAIGNFADPNFPAPTIAVWEESRHPWVSLPPDTPPKRVAKQG